MTTESLATQPSLFFSSPPPSPPPPLDVRQPPLRLHFTADSTPGVKFTRFASRKLLNTDVASFVAISFSLSSLRVSPGVVSVCPTRAPRFDRDPSDSGMFTVADDLGVGVRGGGI